MNEMTDKCKVDKNDVKLWSKRKINDGKFIHTYITKSHVCKSTIFKNKKLLGDNVSLFESLTPLNYHMLKKLKMLKKDKIIHSCWSKEGTIFVKKLEADKKPIIMRNLRDIGKVVENCNV